jgi:hypothetical protein
MKGLLSRGNLILAVSWMMALGMFIVRADRDGARGVGGAKGHAVPAVREELALPAAAVIAAEPGAALTRNDAGRALQ